MNDQDKIRQFEHSIMPHMDAAYNLARWLTGKDQDAEDVVQDAYLRAFKFFCGFRGENGRSWLLRIVRNTFYNWLERNRHAHDMTPFDEKVHGEVAEDAAPDTALLEKTNAELLGAALQALPVEFREILVLRELEGFSYKEIADVADLPLGTVMSRLARARGQLRHHLLECLQKEIL